jgi:hypothetical protein
MKRKPKLEQELYLPPETPPEVLLTSAQLGIGAGALRRLHGVSVSNQVSGEVSETEGALERIDSDTPGANSLNLIKDEVLRGEVEQAWLDYTALYKRIGLTAPTLDKLAEDNIYFLSSIIDYDLISRSDHSHRARPKRPEFIISTPLPLAPNGSGASWKELLDILINDPTTPRWDNKYFRFTIDKTTYDKSDQVLAKEIALLQQDQTNGDIHIVEQDDRPWTMTVIEDVKHAPRLDAETYERSVSVSQLLALNAKLAQTGKIPDGGTESWAEGAYDNPSNDIFITLIGWRNSYVAELHVDEIHNLTADDELPF